MKYLKLFLGFIALAILLMPSFSYGQTDETTQSDTASVILANKIMVMGTKLTRSTTDFPSEKDRFAEVLHTNGFGLINKGVFLAQDVFSDGFKRGDISIVLDGERYHCACPNRMDSPLARTNSLEMESIDLNKTSASEQSNIGGCVCYHREKPRELALARVGMTQSLGASETSDFGFIYNTHNHRLAGRYATGKGYEDAEGKSFVDLYGFKENSSYELIEGSITGMYKNIIYRSEITYTKDIMFPYLLMDERENKVFSLSLEYNDIKLYMNYTDHLMDNGLRTSMGSMITDASNLTVGLTGSFYELYYRNWNADNEIRTPMTTINNHMIPDVGLLSGTISQRLESDYFTLWGRFGFVYQKIANEEDVKIYQLLNEKATDSRSYALFDIGVNHFYDLLNNLSGSITLDFSKQTPPVENLYISVKKPAGKEWWVGNPTLKSPARTSLRANIQYKDIIFEAYGTYIWDYVNLVGQNTPERNYRTYENIDAVLFGFNLSGNWKYYDITASYIWAENESDKTPLVEIVPFSVRANLKSPAYKNISGNIRFSYNDAQTRIDESLYELPTSSWFQVDLGLNYKMKALMFSLTIQNLTDELYYQHMSYLRDPFSSGARVYEPGRTIMLNVLYNSDILN